MDAVSAPAPSKLCFAFLTVSIWSCCINVRVHCPKFKVLDAQQSGCFNFISPFFKDKSGPYIIFLLSLPASVHHVSNRNSVWFWNLEKKIWRKRFIFTPPGLVCEVCVLQLVLWIRPMSHVCDKPAISQHQGGTTPLPTNELYLTRSSVPFTELLSMYILQYCVILT